MDEFAEYLESVLPDGWSLYEPELGMESLLEAPDGLIAVGEVVQLNSRRSNVLRHLSDQAVANALFEAMTERDVIDRRIKLFDDELRRRKSQPKDA